MICPIESCLKEIVYDDIKRHFETKCYIIECQFGCGVKIDCLDKSHYNTCTMRFCVSCGLSRISNDYSFLKPEIQKILDGVPHDCVNAKIIQKLENEIKIEKQLRAQYEHVKRYSCNCSCQSDHEYEMMMKNLDHLPNSIIIYDNMEFKVRLKTIACKHCNEDKEIEFPHYEISYRCILPRDISITHDHKELKKRKQNFMTLEKCMICNRDADNVYSGINQCDVVCKNCCTSKFISAFTFQEIAQRRMNEKGFGVLQDLEVHPKAGHKLKYYPFRCMNCGICKSSQMPDDLKDGWKCENCPFLVCKSCIGIQID
ncbi:UNKNOWN [Stylonychia lemnae]|uniref:Uncharacterized protein n=1 Tax=Stylonychia lemnae TaxID=5949 RepID=A0A077ZXG9_STYLE|nr:UNKNOWN [Stylonychia lemnae]|eukprot:CDW74606.1 UNKNOWN [Stylonychia lemnae]